MKEFDHDMINRYLDGEMNAEEQLAFEAAMRADADLQKETELTNDVKATLKIKLHPDQNEIALRHALQGMKAEYFEGKRPGAKIIPLSRRRWMTAIAAMFITALLLTVWQPWKKEDLYQQYAAITMPTVAERGSTSDSILTLAVTNFNNRKFADAIHSFEAVLNDSAQLATGIPNSFVQYYYAIALLQDDQIGKARDRFSEIINSPSIFGNDATFYMALSFLKEKNIAACKEWLNKIPSDTEAWIKAQKLLQKL